jgi:hypothetical protein
VPKTDVSIFGVEHTNDRIHDRIEEEADRIDLDVVYHEWPESSHSFQAIVGWGLLKNPVVIAPSLLYLVRSMIAMRRAPSIDSSGTVYLKSECKVAAESLRDEYNAKLVNIGMDRVELLKRRSWASAAVSWGIAIIAIWIVTSAIVSNTPSTLWGLIVPILLSIIHRHRTLSNVRDERDEYMATAILKDIDHREPSTAFVLVGEKHVQGIGVHLSIADLNPVCRWLIKEAETEEPGGIS